MKSGIYKILNKVTEKFYIGSAVNFKVRWTAHKSNLNRQTHKNKYLQSSWNLHGEDNFQFIIIEYCEKEKLPEREQFWLDNLKPYDRLIGYNLYTIAGSPLRTKWTEERKIAASERMKNFKHTDEAKAKMRGRAFSAEHKANLAISKLGHAVSDETKLKIKIANTHLNDKSFRAKQNASVSKPDKWPHGISCKCRECKDKKNEYTRNWHKARKENLNVQA